MNLLSTHNKRVILYISVCQAGCCATVVVGGGDAVCGRVFGGLNLVVTLALASVCG